MQSRLRLYKLENYRNTTIDEHQELYEAIMDRDAQQAKKVAQVHIFHVREAIAEFRRADERLEVSLRRIGSTGRSMEDLT